MPKAFSEQERELVRGRLIEQGARLFAAYGLKKTSVEELAGAAGISKGAFYLFYETKESLYMDVAERAEQDFRKSVLTSVEQPGPTPRARLLAALRTAFSIWKTMPVLQAFSRADLDMLSTRVPAEQLLEHADSDRRFVEELIAHSIAQGIPVTASAEQISGLLYSALFVSLHEGDFGEAGFPSGLDTLLELIAAFCLGEVTLE